MISRLSLILLVLIVIGASGFAAENPEAPLPVDAQIVLNVLTVDINAAKQKGADELRKLSDDLGKKDSAVAALMKKMADDLDAEIQKTLTLDALGNPIEDDPPAAATPAAAPAPAPATKSTKKSR